MATIMRKAFRVALPDSGLVVFRPGDSLETEHYSIADLTSLTVYLAANPTVAVDSADVDAQAVINAVALRLRGGDGVGNYQASQTIVEDGLL